MGENDTVLRVENVSKSYAGRRVVDRVSFSERRGTILGLVGPNGAGKTTLIRVLMGIVAPDEGRVEVLGARSAAEARKRVGYLPEERGLYQKQTVQQVLRYLAKLKGVGRHRSDRRMQVWLERLGISDVLTTNVGALSKGQQQKVQFVATVLHDPDVLLLDEPFGGLDPVSRQQLRAILQELAGNGKTILLSSHEMAEVELLCPQVVMVHLGQMVLCGFVDAIKEDFGDHAVLVCAEGDLTGTATRQRSSSRWAAWRACSAAGRLRPAPRWTTSRSHGRRSRTSSCRWPRTRPPAPWGQERSRGPEAREAPSRRRGFSQTNPPTTSEGCASGSRPGEEGRRQEEERGGRDGPVPGEAPGLGQAVGHPEGGEGVEPDEGGAEQVAGDEGEHRRAAAEAEHQQPVPRLVSAPGVEAAVACHEARRDEQIGLAARDRRGIAVGHPRSTDDGGRRDDGQQDPAQNQDAWASRPAPRRERRQNEDAEQFGADQEAVRLGEGKRGGVALGLHAEADADDDRRRDEGHPREDEARGEETPSGFPISDFRFPIWASVSWCGRRLGPSALCDGRGAAA